MTKTRSVQVRLGQDAFAQLQAIANEEKTSLAEVIRKGIIMFAIAHNYKKEGKTLFWQGRDGVRADLVL